MTPNTLDTLAKAQFVQLTTFRKDGTPVPTPVWIVRDGDELLVWTNPQAGKVKRLRRSPRAMLAPCTRFGEPLGLPVEATGRVLDEADAERVMPLLIEKYGLTARMTQVPNKVGALLGRPPRAAGAVALRVDPEAGPAQDQPVPRR